jgi:hypothetical protein
LWKLGPNEPSSGANAQVWQRKMRRVAGWLSLFEIIVSRGRKGLEELDENRTARDVALYLLRRIIRECQA